MASETKINTIFKAIADPTRREIFHMLIMAGSSLTISQISEQFEMTRQGISKHMRQLEEAGLVSTTIEGRERICKVEVKPLREIRDWLTTYERFFDPRLAELDKMLEQNVDANPMETAPKKAEGKKAGKKGKKKKDKKKKKKKKK